MTSEKKLAANARHLAKLEDIKIRVPKDGTKAHYQEHAAKRGKSLNALFIELIEKDIQNFEEK